MNTHTGQDKNNLRAALLNLGKADYEAIRADLIGRLGYDQFREMQNGIFKEIGTIAFDKLKESKTKVMQEFGADTTNRNAVKNALNECGVGEDLDQRLNAVNEELADFCAQLQKSVTRQAIYNELTNRPCGIEHRNALRMGLVSAIGNLIKWDVVEALELAADIAEDVNAHGESKQIREMAGTLQG